MNLLKEISANSIRILLGILFLASGYLKLYPVEPFELNFIDLGIANWVTAPIIARGIIGFELLLGTLLLFNLAMNKFTIKATYSILIFFTGYLIYQIIRYGNSGNCGCFGTYLQMTPLESIFKNIAMIAVLVAVQFIPATFSLPFPKIFIPLFILSSAITPYILNPPDALIAGHKSGAVNYPLGIKEMYTDSANIKPDVDLTKGRHIVAFMSLSCMHCRFSALKMHVMYTRHPELPFYLILHGDTSKFKKSFFDFTKAQNIPLLYYNEDEFFSYVGGSVPGIFWLQNDTVKYRSHYSDLNEDEIIKWVNTGVVPEAEDTSAVKEEATAE